MTRLPWLLTICTTLALVLLLALGVWQVQRMMWKERLIDRAEAAAALPPTAIHAVMAGPDREFRRVIVDCPGLATAPYVTLQSIKDGQAGVRLISACPIEKLTGQPIADVYLVDRGFVAETISSRPAVARDSAPIRIVASVRTAPGPGPMALPPSDGRFYARDTVAMAAALGVTAEVGPETLYALTSSNAEWPALQPSAPPAAFANNHLGYALTWFGLAVALAGFYVAMVRRKPSLKQPRSASEAIGKEEAS